MKNPYEILNLGENASKEELNSRYNELKAKYSEERFLEGEAGNTAAQNLTDLEAAWLMISSEINKRETTDFSQVESLIKAANYDEAQRLLDDVKIRTAEWHYFQSIVYYKREWLTESRNQLALCVNLEPNNAKYIEALKRMDERMGNSTIKPQDLGGANDNYRPRQEDAAGNALCRCCQAYICMDCCCTLMQCCH